MSKQTMHTVYKKDSLISGCTVWQSANTYLNWTLDVFKFKDKHGQELQSEYSGQLQCMYSVCNDISSKDQMVEIC